MAVLEPTDFRVRTRVPLDKRANHYLVDSGEDWFDYLFPNADLWNGPNKMMIGFRTRKDDRVTMVTCSDIVSYSYSRIEKQEPPVAKPAKPELKPHSDGRSLFG